MQDWPFEYKEKLIVGNKQSNIGIATLWTVKEHVAELLNPNDYCVVANFYDIYNGLEPMVRNCLSNPYIRYILVVGANKSNSKHTLTQFFNSGFTNGLVNETDVEVPKDVPESDLELLRQSVRLIDLTDQITDLNNFQQYADIINLTIKTLDILEPYMEPKIYPKTVQPIDVYPSANVLYTIEDDFVGKAWLRILHTISVYGNDTQTTPDESSKVRECINMVSVIYREDPDDIKMEPYFKFTKDDVYEYYQEFCYNFIPKGTSYTYGSRFRGFWGDQLDMLINKLKDNPHTKRAYATTWSVNDLDSSTPPCVISIQPNIQKNVLFMTSYIRSNDMYRAWPRNVYGLRKLQKMICDKVHCTMGALTVISQSGHVYKDNLKEIQSILDKYYVSTNCFSDVRGYYVIKLIDNKIVSQHYSPSSKLLKTFEGSTAREITDQINSFGHSTNPYHISYIAEELTKAEIALKFNLSYTQDLPLDK